MAVGAKRRRTRRIVLVVAGAIVLLVVLAQVFLPTLAAKRVEDRVARYGTVRSAHVSAFPAVELLWGKADSVSVSAGALAVSAAQIGPLMWEARAAHDMTLTAASLNIRVAALPAGLTMSGVRMEKRGSSIHTTATLTQAQLEEALPSGFQVKPVASGEGEVQVRASGGLFGVQASIEALVRPVEGKLVAEPRGFPLAGIATVTLFSDPHLKVQSVGLRVLSQTPLVYGLSVDATLM